jgi:hypothetical protein
MKFGLASAATRITSLDMAVQPVQPVQRGLARTGADCRGLALCARPHFGFALTGGCAKRLKDSVQRLLSIRIAGS